MALGTRQTNLFAAEDWKKLYTTFSEADFQSYDFESIRKVLVDYLKTYYAEDFNDFTESSEYIALLDLIAFVAQGLAFRTDLNARENFLETAERRDSVIKLVKQLSYNPNRNRSAAGVLKISSVSTTETLVSNAGRPLDRTTVNWNDSGNPDWLVQFNQVLNAAFSSSQKVGKPFASKVINSIKTEQYNISVPSTIVPVFSFTAPVLEAAAPFEAVSATILDDDMILEQDPGIRGQFGIVYQQDGQGYTSSNTGFFLLFKQGQLQSLDFNLTERLPNRRVDIPVDNINNDDIWLYELANGRIGDEWYKVQAMKGSNAIYNSTARGIRALYSVDTRLNDQIALVFGDGTFSDIPQGTYRAYFRVSNGITYRISPADMSGILINIPYISRSGRSETLTVTANLQYTVANSSARDIIDEIKAKAPQNFYTQNRMVNGEDYNIFPYVRYSDIVKVKAVNRFSSGISRNLDVLDPTGRYSSTDIFADDGVVYREDFEQNITFSFNTRNEATAAIRNLVSPLIANNSFKHFYYDRYSPGNIPVIDGVSPLSFSNALTTWERTTSGTTSCTGFFLNNEGTRQQIGEGTSNKRRYLLRNSLIKFVAPAGKYFDANNALVSGVPQLSSDKTYIWATIKNQTGNGTNLIYFAGREVGAITLSEDIPTGSIITECYTPLATQFSSALVSQMTNLIVNKIDFGLRYRFEDTPNSSVEPWKVIAAANLDRDGEFEFTNAGDSSGNGLDSSWLFKFEYDGNKYTITYRGLHYIYSSKDKVRFLNSNTGRVYDSKTNTFIKDNIKVLNINSKPDGSGKLDRDVIWEIYDNIVESDGYVDNSKILVTFSYSGQDGVIIDPTIFSQLSTTTAYNLFFQKFLDFDNLVRYRVLDVGVVNSQYPNQAAVELQRNNYPAGKVFYAYQDEKFYNIVAPNGAKQIQETLDYQGYRGQQNLYFQYKHNADESKRIDPATSNLIDLYILTRNYDEAYRNYINDVTNTVLEPDAPTSFELNNSYNELFEYKMITDGLIISAGIYKKLFGSRADSALRAKIQVVKGSSTTISDNELKSKVIRAINGYFAIENWNFGETFYFSELSAYLHQELSGELSSVILIPGDITKTFGSLYEIRCQPNEIFISAATVDDIEVVSGVLTGINSSGINTTTVKGLLT
jgi:hypothetical protein